MEPTPTLRLLQEQPERCVDRSDPGRSGYLGHFVRNTPARGESKWRQSKRRFCKCGCEIAVKILGIFLGIGMSILIDLKRPRGLYRSRCRDSNHARPSL